MVLVKVAAAVMIRENKILIGKRNKDDILGGLWEFPGGKIEDGETPEVTLRREMEEELGVEIEIGAFIGMNQHTYPHIAIELHAYYCYCVKGEPRALEHQELRWVEVSELSLHEFAPADIPIVNML